MAREFIERNRSIFRYNYSPLNVPLLEFDMNWCKEYLFLESPVDASGGGTIEYGEDLYGLVTSSYPGTHGGWSTICDHVATHLMPKRCLLTLADGCGFGHRQRQAAIAASRAFLEFMSSFQFRAHNSEDFAKGLLMSVRSAHDKVLDSSEGLPQDAGTTTLLGAAVIKLEELEPEPWALVMVNVGDVKAYVWREGSMMEATPGNRGNAGDATDPGGRIGPRDDLNPDLRNLRCYHQPLKAGDIVVLMSDGVHDNFDPQSNGEIAPSLISESVRSGVGWSDMKLEDAMRLKGRWGCDFMSRLLTGLENVTPKFLCETLAAFCLKNTESSRKFMEENPHKRLPSDYTLFPGKMDHTSLIAFRVPANEIELDPEHISDVASFDPAVLGRYLHAPIAAITIVPTLSTSPDASSPPHSPGTQPRGGGSGSLRHAITPEVVAAQRRMSDGVELERLRETLERDGNSSGLQLVGLSQAVFEYNRLSLDDERRLRAEAIMMEYFYDGAVALIDERTSSQAKSVVRLYTKMSGTKLSTRGSKTQLPCLFDKLTPRLMQCMASYWEQYDPKPVEALSSGPMGKVPAARTLGGRLRKMMTSSDTLVNVGPPPSETPSLVQFLKNSCARQKVLALGAQLGYETALRFLVLERDYRREGMERRLDFAKQIYEHFVSSFAPSPVMMTLMVRRSIGAALKEERAPLDLFSDAICEVSDRLNDDFYPQLLSNAEVMQTCVQYFASDKLNQELLEVVSRGDDRQAIGLLDAGADVNYVDSQGYSPLLSAAFLGDYKLCLELLKRGAYVNQVTHDWSTIWHILAAGPHETAFTVPFVWSNELRALLKKLQDQALARPSSINEFKETALHVAVLSHAPVELIRFLSDKTPGLLELKNASGETAFDYAKRIGASQELLLFLAG